MGKHNERVIEKLRRWKPDLSWEYDRKRGNWTNSQGWNVYACCGVTLNESGCETEYTHELRRSDTGERVLTALDSLQQDLESANEKPRNRRASK